MWRSADSFYVVGREICWLTMAMCRVWASEVADLMVWLVSRGPRLVPLSSSRRVLDSIQLTLWVRKRVVTIENGRRFVDASELGAGGTGTSRAWLRLMLMPRGGGIAKPLSVFVKLPASSCQERWFLSAFGVYKNEVDMYSRLLRDRSFKAKFREGLFARVYCASSVRRRFAIVLEDVAASRDAILPTVADAHPMTNVKLALRALADLHAPFLGSGAPRGLGWNPTNRPPFLRLVATTTYRTVQEKYPGLLTPEAAEAYRLLVDNYERVRRAWDTSAPLTMVHGDAHLGNMFFSQNKASFYDLQCIATEHPMRDVSYHLLSSCDPIDLEAGGELALIEFYVKALNDKCATNSHKSVLTVDQAYEQYRLHALWTLAAFVICAGASDLFKENMARLTIGRICKGIQRLDSKGALKLLLARRTDDSEVRPKSNSLSP